jgi:class 3 adenylate cyclase
MVFVPGIVPHLEVFQERPDHVRWMRALSAFARVVVFDKRGNGMSDRIAGAPTLDGLLANWGRTGGRHVFSLYGPSPEEDPAGHAVFVREQRMRATPATIAALCDLAARIDIRGVLPAVTQPTLVLRRADEPISRVLADGIPNAVYREVPAGEVHRRRAAGGLRVPLVRRGLRGRAARRLSGLDMAQRAGVHTGEIERRAAADDGLAVTIAARIADRAGPGEVLVSDLTRLLMTGAPVRFEPRGAAEPRGVPGAWALHAAEPGREARSAAGAGLHPRRGTVPSAIQPSRIASAVSAKAASLMCPAISVIGRGGTALRISSRKAASPSGSWQAPPGRSHSSIPPAGRMTWTGAADRPARRATSRAVSRRSSGLRAEDLISRLWAWNGRSA